MDEMKIGTIFMKKMLAKILETVIKKKFGYDIKIKLNGFAITHNNGVADIHLDIDAQTKDVKKIFEDIGIGV